MSLCRITNLMETSIAIEDIGVHLPARGSNVLIDTKTAERSRDLKSYQKWVRVEAVVSPRLAIWPFTKPVVQPKSIPVALPVAVSSPVPVVSELQQVRETLSTLNSLAHKLSEFMQQTKLVQSPIAAVAASEIVVEKDPIFIPSRVMPKNADVQIQTHEDEIDHASGEAASRMLKGMKRKS
jgi:hypothetical protein